MVQSRQCLPGMIWLLGFLQNLILGNIFVLSKGFYWKRKFRVARVERLELQSLILWTCTLNETVLTCGHHLELSQIRKSTVKFLIDEFLVELSQSDNFYTSILFFVLLLHLFYCYTLINLVPEMNSYNKEQAITAKY